MSVRPRRRCSRAGPRDTVMRSPTLSHGSGPALASGGKLDVEADRSTARNPRRTPMTTISEVERPGLAVRALFKIREAEFRQVAAPELVIARPGPLLLGVRRRLRVAPQR